MDYEEVDDVGPDTQKPSFVELLPKPGCTNLTNSQSDISEKAKKWDWGKVQVQACRLFCSYY